MINAQDWDGVVLLGVAHTEGDAGLVEGACGPWADGAWMTP